MPIMPDEVGSPEVRTVRTGETENQRTGGRAKPEWQSGRQSESLRAVPSKGFNSIERGVIMQRRQTMT